MNEGAEKSYSIKAAFLILAIITGLRAYYLSLGQFNLFFDEAQYWFWSKSFDWGYYSKPPMVAWMISLTTSVCGDGEGCVRLSSPLLHLITSIAIYFTASELFNKKTAFYSAIAYITLPAVSVSSAVVSTDASLLTFWSLSILFFVKALKSNRLRWWILAGLAAGFGMLSKYNMAVGLLGAFAYILISKENRHYIKSPRLWLAVTIAAIIFLPNILWNLNNGFVSFLHTKDNATGEGFSLNILTMLEFFGAQFGVFGPVFFFVLLLAVAEFCIKKDSRSDSKKLLLLMALPMLVIILSVSLLSRAHANWAAPSYVAATIFVVHYLIEKNKVKWIKGSIIFHISLVVILLSIPSLNKVPGIEFTGSKTDLKAGKIKDPFKRLYGWDELGQGASILQNSYPDAAILTDSRKIHSELLYYMRPMPENIVKWNPSGKTGDHYELTTDINKAGTKNFILITKSQNPESIFSYFESNLKIGNISVSPYEDYPIDYWAYYLKGFKGYE